MTPRYDSPWWRDTMGGLSIGDTGGAPVPTRSGITRRRRRRPGAVSGDERRTFETCNWPSPSTPE